MYLYEEENRNMLINIQPRYTELISRYSKSYLSGSLWYVGDDLLKWWDTESIRKFDKKMLIIKVLLEILLNDIKNKRNYEL
jgi:hypothetical protein